MRVGLIGHRGERLGTSKDAIALWIYEVLSFLFQDQEEQAMICGGAEGADELFGRAAHNFDNADLYLYLPVKGYRSKKMDPWLRASAKSEVYMAEQWQPGLDTARDRFLINNCDINKLNTYYLRDIVTYVPQNYELLDLSIEENIIYPLTLDEYKYNDALNKCKLKDLIFSLPNRDETKAREANLQASDVQKIALANAFYKDSPIMILDDSTSKLDSITEDNIMNEFYKLKNKISIVISNRITSVSKCDKILIINNGKVSEYGRVDELLANKHSSFAKMFSDTKPDKKVV